MGNQTEEEYVNKKKVINSSNSRCYCWQWLYSSDDTDLMLMVLVCPSVRAEGAEEDGLRGRVAGRSRGGVWEDPDCDRGGQPGHAGHQVHPG